MEGYLRFSTNAGLKIAFRPKQCPKFLKMNPCEDITLHVILQNSNASFMLRKIVTVNIRSIDIIVSQGNRSADDIVLEVHKAVLTFVEKKQADDRFYYNINLVMYICIQIPHLHT